MHAIIGFYSPYCVDRPIYPHDEGEEEVVQETEGELSQSQMEDEIQEDMMDGSDDDEGTFLDLTSAMDQEGGGAHNEVCLILVMMIPMLAHGIIYHLHKRKAIN